MKLKNRVTVKSGTILDLVELQLQFWERCVTQGMKCSSFLYKKTCYKSKFRSLSTDWGDESDNDAYNKYCKSMLKSHASHSVNLLDFIWNLNFPYLGASPDGIVNVCLA